jgi:thiol-disulfide isomerase/thioredoxin
VKFDRPTVRRQAEHTVVPAAIDPARADAIARGTREYVQDFAHCLRHGPMEIHDPGLELGQPDASAPSYFAAAAGLLTRPRRVRAFVQILEHWVSLRRQTSLAALGILVAFTAATAAAGADASSQDARPLPEFTHDASDDWINSEPLRVADLHGRVVLLHVWTFECWNCYRSFPWLESVVERFGPRGLVTIGVHSPEFERERVRDDVVARAKQFGMKHPTMIDNDFSYWRALDNHYWPAWYLVDQQGDIRTLVVGEIHRADRRAAALEGAIERLLSAQRASGTSGKIDDQAR